MWVRLGEGAVGRCLHKPGEQWCGVLERWGCEAEVDKLNERKLFERLMLQGANCPGNGGRSNDCLQEVEGEGVKLQGREGKAGSVMIGEVIGVGESVKELFAAWA